MRIENQVQSQNGAWKMCAGVEEEETVALKHSLQNQEVKKSRKGD